MKQFVAQPPFWQLFPESRIGVLAAFDMNTTPDEESLRQIETLLQECNHLAAGHLTAEVFSENPSVAVWREAYRKFKTKKGVRSSIEAMLKRVEKGNGVGSITPLVDLYNSISLRYALPCGGEDIDALAGDLRLTVTEGDDDFLALGDEHPDPTLPGEVCYLDDVGAVCRCWNWRDGQRTMLTEHTRNAVLVIESVDPARHTVLAEALETLAADIARHLGGRTQWAILDQEHPTFPLGE